GSTWTSITGLPQAGDAGAVGTSEYGTLRLADIDGEPGQELLGWDSVDGVTALKYAPGPGGGAWKALRSVQAFGPPCVNPNGSGSDDPSCWSTLQTVPFGQAGAAVMMRLPQCN